MAVVRPDRIGDFVLASPTLARFREAFEGKRLTLFAHPAWVDLARWLNATPVVEGRTNWVDAIEPFDPNWLISAEGFRRMRKTLARYETVVYPAPSRTNAMDLLLSGLPGRTMGAKGDGGNQWRWLARRLEGRYDRLVAIPNGGLEYARNAAFLVRLAPDVAVPGSPPRWEVPGDWVAKTVASVSGRVGFDAAAPYVVISPFTSVPLKDWPLGRFAAAWEAVCREHPGLRGVLLGSGANRRRMGPLERLDGVCNLAGETTLAETVALLAGAGASLSGDTAAAHIASAVGTPAAVVLGGGHHGRFFPYEAPHETGQNMALCHEMPCYRCNWVCRYRPFGWRAAPCVERVSPAHAAQAVASILVGARTARRES